jgi:hypothetical protein
MSLRSKIFPNKILIIQAYLKAIQRLSKRKIKERCMLKTPKRSKMSLSMPLIGRGPS